MTLSWEVERVFQNNPSDFGADSDHRLDPGVLRILTGGVTFNVLLFSPDFVFSSHFSVINGGNLDPDGPLRLMS